MDYLERRTTIINRIDEIEDELIAWKTLHEKPELAFQEFEAVRNITTLLKKHGFKVIARKGKIKNCILRQNTMEGLKDLRWRFSRI